VPTGDEVNGCCAMSQTGEQNRGRAAPQISQGDELALKIQAPYQRLFDNPTLAHQNIG
jgi:hypothetical protein